MRLKIFWFALNLALAICLHAQQARLHLRVTDAETGVSVGMASIQVGAFFGKADAVGHFSAFLTDTVQPITLSVTATGYQPFSIKKNWKQLPSTIALTPYTTALQDVVVSGTLKPMRRLESPIPVESYSTSFLKANPTPSIFEGLVMANGIQPQMTCNVCNTGDIRINGMDGAYTMVLIDGMPIVSSLSTVYGLSGIPNSIIKRIEVVKGPASTLYGSEAVGGIINIITKDPLTAGRFSTDVNVSTVGELSADFGAKLKWKKATGLLGANLFYYNTPQDVNRDGFTDMTLQQRASLFNKWDWTNRGGKHSSFAIRLLTEYRWGGQMNFQKSLAGGDSLYGESIHTRRAELIGRQSLQRNLLLEYSYNFHWQNSYYGTTYFKAGQHTAFAQMRWEKQLGNHQLLAGIPIRFLYYDDNTSATRKPDGNKPSLQRMTGVYAQDEIKWNQQWTTLAGLRYEHNNLQGGVIAPRIATKWQPAEHHTVRLSGGNGFRIVNLFTEDHAALSGFREIVIRNDLKPERSWNANLNYSGDLHLASGVLGFDLTAFYTWFANKIVPDYDTDPQKIIYDNLDGHAISKGLSGMLNLTLKNGIKASSGITWMEVYTKENDLKTSMVYAPKWSGSYSVAIPVRKAGITLDITGKWYGPMRLPVVPNDFRPSYSPWYQLLNVQITKKWNDRWESYLALKNLLNFLQDNPILHPDDPFDKPGGRYWNTDGTPNGSTNPNGYSFDPSYNYAPMQGIKAMAGIRLNLQ